MKTILWAALGAVLLATPAAAQLDPVNNRWRECVVTQLTLVDMVRGSVGAIGVRIAQRCEILYQGPKYADVDVVVELIEKLRSQQEKEPQIVTEPPRKMSPADKRY